MGMTSSATVLVIVFAGAAAVSLLAGTDLRTAAGALLLAAYPIAVGVWVSLLAPPWGDPGGPFLVGRAAFDTTFGSGVVAAIAWAGLLSAGLLARAGPARIAAAAGAIATVAVLLPAMPRLIDTVTGAGAILYRLVWVAPVPAMIHRLATVRIPARDRCRGGSGGSGGSRRASVEPAGSGCCRPPPWSRHC